MSLMIWGLFMLTEIYNLDTLMLWKYTIYYRCRGHFQLGSPLSLNEILNMFTIFFNLLGIAIKHGYSVLQLKCF